MSGDDTIRFSELVRRTPFPGKSEWLALRPNHFQKGLAFGGLSPVSGPGEGRLGKMVPLLPRLKGSFFFALFTRGEHPFPTPSLD